jgi:hypothetical protein
MAVLDFQSGIMELPASLDCSVLVVSRVMVLLARARGCSDMLATAGPRLEKDNVSFPLWSFPNQRWPDLQHHLAGVKVTA